MKRGVRAPEMARRRFVKPTTRTTRPASYAAMTAALQPFASGSMMPAPLPLRFVAGLIDAGVLMAKDVR